MNRILLLWFVSLGVIGCSKPVTDTDAHPFEIVELKDGVYGAIAVEGSEAMANAGIIDLGDGRIILFDTFLTPKAGAQLKSRAEEVTGGEVFLVANSSAQSAHVRGNQHFGDKIIIGTIRRQELITEKESARLRDEKANVTAMRTETQSKLDTDGDAGERADLERKLAYLAALENSMHDVVTTTITLIWQTRINFHGGARSAKIIPLGPAVTEDDGALLVIQDSVLFAGDVVVVDRHPDMVASDLAGWRAALDSLAMLSPKQIVPGHGPPTDESSLEQTRAYLDMVEQTAMAVVSGETDLDSAEPQPPFDGLFRVDRFKSNLEAVIRQLDL